MLPSSFFIDATLVERVVELPDGSKHTLHFRELPVTEFRKFQEAERHSDPEVRAGAMALLISMSLCNPDGTPAMVYSQAMQLKTRSANALVRQVLDVCGWNDGDKRKND